MGAIYRIYSRQINTQHNSRDSEFGLCCLNSILAETNFFSSWQSSYLHAIQFNLDWDSKQLFPAPHTATCQPYVELLAGWPYSAIYHYPAKLFSIPLIPCNCFGKGLQVNLLGSLTQEKKLLFQIFLGIHIQVATWYPTDCKLCMCRWPQIFQKFMLSIWFRFISKQWSQLPILLLIAVFCPFPTNTATVCLTSPILQVDRSTIAQKRVMAAENQTR